MSHMSEFKAEPNLTPLLDMVFQLITFFMLVLNFKGAEADMSLQLPVLGSARPVDTQGNESLLVLNIDRQGKLKVYGKEEDFKKFIANEAHLETERQKRGKGFKPEDGLPTMVVIRADRATPFELLYDIMKTCQDHGYRKFALNAMNRTERS
jgi:biopolymer transport protein ExbD